MTPSSDGRSAMMVGAGIFISRVLGLVRTTFFAHYFGSTSAGDALNVALKIPNIVRNVLGEGTLSAAFVPAYSRLLTDVDSRRSRALAAAVLGLLLVAVSTLTLLGIAGAPLITGIVALGASAEQQALITRLTRIMFPMTGLMVLSGFCLGVQNSHRRFFWSYASAALWSLAQIVLLWGWGDATTDRSTLALWLAWGTLVGAVLQVGVQLPEVIRLVGVLRPSLDRNAEGVRALLRNLVPVTTALGVVQISSVIDTQIASFLPGGTQSNLSYANQLVLLPVSLFGVSVAAAVLPELSRDSGAARMDALLERLRSGWQRVLFYVVPCAVVFAAFGNYCVGIVFRTGAFGAAEERAVHAVLAASAVGLVSFGSVKLLVSAYYALQDYRTPLRASVTSLVVSAAASIMMAYAWRNSHYGAAAIALGSAIGSYVNFSMLVRGLRHRLGALYTAAMWRGTRRIVMSSMVATVVALLARVLVQSQWPTLHPRIAGPPILLAFGVTYLVCAWWMGSAEAARWIRQPVRSASAR